MSHVREFTKDRPCNKIDIWNAFRGKRRFVVTTMRDAKMVIGENVPGHLVRNGRAEFIERKGEECIKLTAEGEEWLKKGATIYIRNQHKAGNKNVLSSVLNPMSSWREQFA